MELLAEAVRPAGGGLHTNEETKVSTVSVYVPHKNGKNSRAFTGAATELNDGLRAIRNSGLNTRQERFRQNWLRGRIGRNPGSGISSPSPLDPAC